MGKIIPKASSGKRIVDVGARSRRIDPEVVAKALGAEDAGVEVELGGGPISLFQVRSALAERLQSQGGRPALEGTTRRVKIPVSESRWREIEELADSLSDQDSSPTAGQVASVLLSLSLPHARKAAQRIKQELAAPGPAEKVAR